MIPSVFVSMSDGKMASLIGRAQRRVAVAAPAIRQLTATALLAAKCRIAPEAFAVVTDCDEEVFRLGYGDFKAIKTLQEAGVPLRQSSGLRIGVLLCDDEAWVFAPTALYVEPEVQSDETPNALALRSADVERLASRLLLSVSHAVKQPELALLSPAVAQAIESLPENLRLEVVNAVTGSTSQFREEIATASIEIGHEAVQQHVLEQTEKSLALAPPVAFDVARQIRVFEPYIQYVEINLKGCHIERRTIELPKSIQGLDPNAELGSRLHTKFDLIEKSSTVSSDKIDSEVKQLRDNFTRALGKPWGRVLLRNVRPTFDTRVEELRQKLQTHKANVEAELAAVLTDSRDRLIEHFFPLVKASPPDSLIGQINTRPPTDEQIRKWLSAELDKTMPKPFELMSEMKLEVQFRDVTYETLNEQGFEEKLRAAYQQVDWDKPFSEFDAAKARDA